MKRSKFIGGLALLGAVSSLLLVSPVGCRKSSEAAAGAGDEIAALRQEVAALRDEVAQLRRSGGRKNAAEASAEEAFPSAQTSPTEVLQQLATMREQLAASQREVASNLVQITVDRGSDAWRRGDFKEALKLLKPLAEEGQPIAAHRLGVMYVLGQGVPRDSAEAIKYFSQAAE